MSPCGLRIVIALATSVVAGCASNRASPDAAHGVCGDGFDNDGDGSTDFPADPGCDDLTDNDETNDPIAMCSDTRDNDGDGLIDYPSDPGCYTPLQNSELDDCPAGPTCPACANDLDDDGDGATDYPMDAGCTAASEGDELTTHPNACGPGLMVALLQTTVVSGTLPGSPSLLAAATCGGAGGEVPYEIAVTQPTVLVATTDLPGTMVDTVLYLRTECTMPATEIVCNDDTGALGVSASTITAVLAPGVYFLIVDSRDAGVSGGFALRVDRLAGQGQPCTSQADCGPGLQCRVPPGGTEMICTDPVCDDNADSDGDTRQDYPEDPGCTGPDDFDETDDCPTGASCPACANGVDDDGDGATDYPADPDCVAASRPAESCVLEMDPIQVLTGGQIVGDTTGASDDFDPSCGFAGADEVVLVALPHMQSFHVDLAGTAFDAVLAIHDQSCANELACDDAFTAGGESIDLGNLAAGTYSIVVDGWSTNAGPYSVHVAGVIAPLGACTDPLAVAGVIACPGGYSCTGGACLGTMQCNNGVDDDGDGEPGFPSDPGCTSPTDNNENDTCPSGGSCPDCGNNLDDDGDGLIDYPDDPSCTSASINNENLCPQESSMVTAITMPTYTGSTTGGSDNFTPACASLSPSQDRTFALNLPVPVQTLVVDTIGSNFDTVLSVTNGACTTIACDDQSGGSNTSQITMSGLAAGGYGIIVDGWNGEGNYNLHVRGTVAPGAACTSPLFVSGVLACSVGQTCIAGMCQ